MINAGIRLRRLAMSEGEALYLALAIGAAAVFAITLAWVSRTAPRQSAPKPSAQERSKAPEDRNEGGRVAA
jgi:hypothetical protein